MGCVTRTRTRVVALSLMLLSANACIYFVRPDDPLDSSSVRVNWHEGTHGRKVVGHLVIWDSAHIAVKPRNRDEVVQVARADVTEVRRYRGLDRETPAILGALGGAVVGLYAAIVDRKHCSQGGMLCNRSDDGGAMVGLMAVAGALVGAKQGREIWETVSWLGP